MVLKPVIQEEATGCGIASVANILGKTYPEMKAAANALGIYAEDQSLWSDTQYVRRMLSHMGVETSPDEIPLNRGMHCLIWHYCPSSTIRKMAENSGTGLFSNAQVGWVLCWIQQATCHPISERISVKCSPSGLSRSRIHKRVAGFQLDSRSWCIAALSSRLRLLEAVSCCCSSALTCAYSR